MIPAKTPFDLFTPRHIAWLYRSDKDKLDVAAADLDMIELHQPEAAADPLFIEYRTLAETNKLYRRRGRKPLSSSGRLRLWAAWFAIQDEKARIWMERRGGLRTRAPYEETPVHQAAELVARSFRYGSGRALLNRIARERIPHKY